MKIKTKQKIIRFVVNILNYNEYFAPIPREDIKIARVTHIYLKKETYMISDEQIKFGLNFKLIDKLMDVNAIKYTQEIAEDGKSTKVKAEIKVLLK